MNMREWERARSAEACAALGVQGFKRYEIEMILDYMRKNPGKDVLAAVDEIIPKERKELRARIAARVDAHREKVKLEKEKMEAEEKRMRDRAARERRFGKRRRR